MIEGRFGENDELIFEIELMTKNGEIISVDVMLDMGFTAGYLAIDLKFLSVLSVDYQLGILTLESIDMNR